MRISLNRHGKNTAIIAEIGKKIGLSDNKLESFIQSPILDIAHKPTLAMQTYLEYLDACSSSKEDKSHE